MSRIEAAIDNALRYVADRQCADGGFCAYRSEYLEESNLHDTYYAISTYQVAARPVPDAHRVIDYLAAHASVVQAVAPTFFFLMSARMLAAQHLLARYTDTVPAFAARLANARDRVSLSNWLTRTLMLVRLQQRGRDAALKVAIERVRDDLQRGGLGDPPNLVDTHIGLAILAEVGISTRLETTREFVDQLQVSDIGFADTPHSLRESIEVLYAGVLSCCHLDLEVRYATDIVNLVLAAQSNAGGFARAPGSQGDLESHYQSLAVIGALNSEELSAKFHRRPSK